jgi:4-amino-4-deoxy-L-arabinose transferase-like glycosyltransferase
MILLAYRFRDRSSTGGVVLLGCMCGLLALTRSEQILVLPLLVFPLILAAAKADRRRLVVWLGLATATTLVVVAPWTIFNLGRFHRPVLLSNGFGAAAVTGNCQIAYYGAETGYGDLRCLPLFAKGDQSLQDTEDAHTALTYAEGHLSRLPVVLVAREGRTFGFWNPFQQATIDAQWMGTWVGVTRLSLVGYWLLLVPAVVGGVVLRRRRVAIFPLLSFVAIAAVAVLPTIGDVRYRATAEIPLILLASVAVDAALHGRRPGGTDLEASAAPAEGPATAAPQAEPAA